MVLIYTLFWILIPSHNLSRVYVVFLCSCPLFCVVSGREGFEHASNSVELQLVQSNDCGKDEYYIQSADDGQYLTVKRVNIEGTGHRHSDHCGLCIEGKHGFEEMKHRFQEKQSEATLFRFRKYRHSSDPWRKRLEIGSQVLVVNAQTGNHNPSWVKGYVEAFRKNEFGTEIQVKYSGIQAARIDEMVPQYEPRKVSGTLWVPIESDRICRRDCNDTLHPHKIWKESDFPEYYAEERERERVMNLYGQIGDEAIEIGDRTVPDGENRFERRVKSRERRIMKKRKNEMSRNWNSKNNRKRMERKSKKYGKMQQHIVSI